MSGPLERLLQARGKRLRPALVIAVAAALGKPVDDTVISACVAVELIHISSLIHDDVMDEADTRWNVPTINAREGLEQAILIGDYLFANGCAEAATINVQASGIVTSAFVAICRGQAAELASLHDLHRTDHELFEAINGKTSSLIAAACQLGGVCANAPDAQLQALDDFGTAFGTSFQLVDDVLDFIADPQRFGKPVGNDVREGNYTLPLILALQTARANEIKSCLQNTPAKLPQLLNSLGTIQATVEKSQAYNQAAKESLKNFKHTKSFEALKNFPTDYTAWALANLSQ